MKPIINFRDHPGLRYDHPQSIFTIEGKMYLCTEDDVVKIAPKSITRTNIGEPYAELARFTFSLDNEFQSIDIDPEDAPRLIEMCMSIGVMLALSGWLLESPPGGRSPVKLAKI